MKHPFKAGNGYYCDAAERIRVVRDLNQSGNIAGLKRILNDPVGTDLQATVRQRCEAAIRRLERKGS